MKLDAARWRQAVAARGGGARAYLLHGPDAAAIAAAAQDFARTMGADAERVDLDGATLRGDPARLADEAASLSLFGATRFIRVGAVGEETVPALDLLLGAERAGNPVLLLAPGLRATARLAKLAIESPLAGAMIFYEPGPADLERLVAGMAREHGLSLAPGIARALVDASDGDRGVIEREVDKLALYLDAAPDRPATLDGDTLDRIGAARDETDPNAVVSAVVDGMPAALAAALAPYDADGASPVPWLRAVVRRLIALAEMRAGIDAGEAAGVVTKRHRVFFREEAATEAALRRWNAAMLARAIDQLRSAERAAMGGSAAGATIAVATALAIARGIASRR